MYNVYFDTPFFSPIFRGVLLSFSILVGSFLALMFPNPWRTAATLKSEIQVSNMHFVLAATHRSPMLARIAW